VKSLPWAMKWLATTALVAVMKPGALWCYFLRPECAKTHLQASIGQNNIWDKAPDPIMGKAHNNRLIIMQYYNIKAIII